LHDIETVLRLPMIKHSCIIFILKYTLFVNVFPLLVERQKGRTVLDLDL
jgi:hypothetical protein